MDARSTISRGEVREKLRAFRADLMPHTRVIPDEWDEGDVVAAVEVSDIEAEFAALRASLGLEEET